MLCPNCGEKLEFDLTDLSGCEGGASANNVLMQHQADILQAAVNRPVCVEGAACWSPAVPAMGMGPPKKAGSVSP